MLGEFLLLAYVAAVGFVAAGIAASFYKMVTLEPARFRLLGQSFFSWMTAMIFCAVTGPFIVVDQAIQSRRRDHTPILWVFAVVGIATLWSCCLGVLVLELILTVGDSFA